MFHRTRRDLMPWTIFVAIAASSLALAVALELILSESTRPGATGRCDPGDLPRLPAWFTGDRDPLRDASQPEFDRHLAPGGLPPTLEDEECGSGDMGVPAEIEDLLSWLRSEPSVAAELGGEEKLTSLAPGLATALLEGLKTLKRERGAMDRRDCVDETLDGPALLRYLAENQRLYRERVGLLSQNLGIAKE